MSDEDRTSERAADHPSGLISSHLKEAEISCQESRFDIALAHYGACLQLKPDDGSILSFRSRVHIEVGNLEEALKDATAAVDIDPSFVMAHVCKAQALIGLDRVSDALVVFSQAFLATKDQESSELLLKHLVDCCLDDTCIIRESFAATYSQLREVGLDRKPVAVLAVIGQELLALGYFSSSVLVLEAALGIETKSLKLRGSVLSALSTAQWGCANHEQALSYMLQDLEVANLLGDVKEKCRCLTNVGAGYFAIHKFQQALTYQKEHFRVAHEWHQRTSCEASHDAVAQALSSMARTYTALGNYDQALNTHKQCVGVYHGMGNSLAEAQQLGYAGIVYAILGKFSDAMECHNKHLQLAKGTANNMASSSLTLNKSGLEGEGENLVEMSRAFFNLGVTSYEMKEFAKSVFYFRKVKEIGVRLQDSAIEAKAYGGEGTAHRLHGDYEQALACHQKQLDLAKALNDSHIILKAHSQLGIVFYLRKDYTSALKNFSTILTLAQESGSKVEEGRACGQMASCYVALRQYQQAIQYYLKEIEVCQSLSDRMSECVACGNLGLSYQCCKEFNKAEDMLLKQVSIANSLNNTNLVITSHFTTGNFYAYSSHFDKALPYFKALISLTVEKPELEVQTHYVMAYIYFRLNDFPSSASFYSKCLLLYNQLNDRAGLAKSFCNLGIVYHILGRFQSSIKCQERFYSLSSQAGDYTGVFKALGYIGDVYTLQRQYVTAKRYYEQQEAVASDFSSRGLQIEAAASVGFVNMKLNTLDAALQNFSKMLTLTQQAGDVQGECSANLYLGRTHMRLNNFHYAGQFLEEALSLARRLGDKQLTVDVYHSLGDCKRAEAKFSEAISTYRALLVIVERESSSTFAPHRISLLQKIGECSVQMGDSSTGIELFQSMLALCGECSDYKSACIAFHCLADAFVAEEQHTNADEAFSRLVALCEERASLASSDGPEWNSRLYSALHDHAMFLMDIGRITQAIPKLKKCQQLTDEERSREQETALALGICYDRDDEDCGDSEKALSYFQMAIRFSEPESEQLCIAQLYLGTCLLTLERSEEGRDVLEKCVLLADQVGALEVQQGALAKLAALACDSGRKDEAVELYERALAVLDKSDECQLIDRSEIVLSLTGCLLGVGQVEKCRPIIDQSLELIEHEDRENAVDAELLSIYKKLTHSMIQICAIKGEAVAALRLAHVLQLVECDWPMRRLPELTNKSHELIQLLISRDQNDRQQAAASSSLVYCLSPDCSVLYIWLISGARIALFTHCKLPAASGTNHDFPSLIEGARRELGIAEASTSPRMNRITGISSETESEIGDKSKFLVPNQFFSDGDSSACLRTLHDIVLPSDLDQHLREVPCGGILTIILDGSLVMVPFNSLVLSNQTYLHQSFQLQFRLKMTDETATAPSRQSDTPFFILGNPLISEYPQNEHSRLANLPSSGHEASLIAEVCNTEPTIREDASRETLIEALVSCQCVHLACHIDWHNWKFILAPSSVDKKHSELSFEQISRLGACPAVVVISPPHQGETSLDISSSGLAQLVRSFLAGGTGCVVVSQWRLSESASKVLMKWVYIGLCECSSVSDAVANAMRQMQKSSKFSHFCCWASLLMFGDASSKIHHSDCNALGLLASMLKGMGEGEEAVGQLRIVLRMLSKTVARLQKQVRNPLYTSLSSVQAKIHKTGHSEQASDWLRLLLSLGFTVQNESEPMLYFPTVDRGLQLQRFSRVLSLVLQLPRQTRVMHDLGHVLLTHPAILAEMESALRLVVGRSRNSNHDIVLLESSRVEPQMERLLASCGVDVVVARARPGRCYLQLKTQNELKAAKSLYKLLSCVRSNETAEAAGGRRGKSADSISTVSFSAMSQSARSETPLSVSSRSVSGDHLRPSYIHPVRRNPNQITGVSQSRYEVVSHRRETATSPSVGSSMSTRSSVATSSPPPQPPGGEEQISGSLADLISSHSKPRPARVPSSRSDSKRVTGSHYKSRSWRQNQVSSKDTSNSQRSSTSLEKSGFSDVTPSNGSDPPRMKSAFTPVIPRKPLVDDERYLQSSIDSLHRLNALGFPSPEKQTVREAAAAPAEKQQQQQQPSWNVVGTRTGIANCAFQSDDDYGTGGSGLDASNLSVQTAIFRPPGLLPARNQPVNTSALL